jgi:hypothetical protein
MAEPQKLDQIDRLMSAFSLAGARASDPEQSLRNYLLAVECWELVDVTTAVDAFIVGNVPGVHRGFLPTSAELGGECRRQHGIRLESARRANMTRPLPAPEPVIAHPPDSRSRVKAMVVEFVDEHGPDSDNDWWQYGPLPPIGGRRP